MSKYILRFLALVAIISALCAAVIHIIEGDLTGAMTWLLACLVNCVMFAISVVSIEA